MLKSTQCYVPSVSIFSPFTFLTWSGHYADCTNDREAVAAKAAEAAKKKAEKEALLAEEEKSQRAIPKSANAKAAVKKSRGTLDLEELDDPPSESKKTPALNATGIDNALDALSITNDSNATKVERHPERRFKAAYKAYEERRLLEIEQEHPGLRKNQRVEIVRKEFEKSEENPFNQGGNVGYDASKEELAEKKKAVREGVEMRLAER